MMTDCMNVLQHIGEKRHGPVLVTLNAPFEPEESKMFGKYRYDHPILDAKVIIDFPSSRHFLDMRFSYKKNVYRPLAHKRDYTRSRRNEASPLPAHGPILAFMRTGSRLASARRFRSLPQRARPLPPPLLHPHQKGESVPGFAHRLR
jgi:hypothetical protein